MRLFTRPSFRIGLMLVFISVTTNANAQFFKKLGKAIQKAANTIEQVTQPSSETTTRTMKIYKQPDSAQTTDSLDGSSKKNIAEGALNRWNNAAQIAAQKNSQPNNTKSTNTNKQGGKLLPGQRIALAVQQQAEYEKQFYINDTIYKKELLGEYNTFDKMKKIYALTEANSTKAHAFLIEPVVFIDFWGGNNALIKIENTATFYTDLQKLLAKYKEWAKTAEANNVGDFSKEIDIPLPIEAITFYRGRDIYAGKWNNKKFTFFYKSSSHSIAIGCNDEWKGLNDDTSIIQLAFKNDKEFSDFIKFFNPKDLKKLIDFQKQGGLFH